MKDYLEKIGGWLYDAEQEIKKLKTWNVLIAWLSFCGGMVMGYIISILIFYYEIP